MTAQLKDEELTDEQREKVLKAVKRCLRYELLTAKCDRLIRDKGLRS